MAEAERLGKILADMTFGKNNLDAMLEHIEERGRRMAREKDNYTCERPDCDGVGTHYKLWGGLHGLLCRPCLKEWTRLPQHADLTRRQIMVEKKLQFELARATVPGELQRAENSHSLLVDVAVALTEEITAFVYGWLDSPPITRAYEDSEERPPRPNEAPPRLLDETPLSVPPEP